MMYNTGNPVGSTAPKDLYDNTQVLDKLVVGTDPMVLDRLGAQRYSWAGMEYDFQNAQAGREQEFQDFLDSSAFIFIGDYGAGLTFTNRSQYMIRDGGAYRLAPSATLPYTTTGNWATEAVNFTPISSDDILRQDLADPTKGAELVAGAAFPVASFADLQATSGRYVGDRCQLLGYYPGQAGASFGGGFFTWKTSGVDDGGSIAAAPGGAWHRESTGVVYAEMYGANGTSDQVALLAAANFAVANGQYLLTFNKQYSVTSAFRCPEGLKWASYGTEVHQAFAGDGLDNNHSVLWPEDRVTISGDITVSLVDSPGASSRRSGVMLGDIATGVGAVGFRADGITVVGGHDNMNGVSCLGGTNDIRIKSIRCGDTDKIGRLFMAHWGNFNDHYRVGSTLTHTPGGGPTTHPHDIKIGEVIAGAMTTASTDFVGVFCVSAGYDIEVGHVHGDVQNTQSSSYLAMYTAGDIGFAYANTEEKAQRARGIKIGSITGKAARAAYRKIGLALYWDNDSGGAPKEDFQVRLHDSIDYVDAQATSPLATYCVTGHNGRGQSSYGQIRSTSFSAALSSGLYDGGTDARLVEAVNNGDNAIIVSGSGSVVEDYPRDVTIGTLRVNGTGLITNTASGSYAVRAQKMRRLSIERLIVEKLNSAFSVAAGSFLNDVDEVYIGETSVLDPLYSLAYAHEISLTGDYRIDVVNVRGASITTPTTGGYTSRAAGGKTVFSWPGGAAVPAGIKVKIGDVFEASTAAVGQPWLSIVTVAGVTGSTATVTNYITR